MKKQTKVMATLSTAALLALGFSAVSMAAGWDNSTGAWRYLNNDGTEVVDEWKSANGNWFYLDSDGVMATDKLIEDETGKTTKYYYVDQYGAMVKNTWKAVAMDDDDNSDLDAEYWWYYFGNDGKAYTTDSDKVLKKSTIKTINGLKYGFDEEGHMLYGWTDSVNHTQDDNDDELWKTAEYYFNGWNDGHAQTGWAQIAVEDDNETKNYWFYFSGDGVKKTKHCKINGKYYAFASDGHMIDEWVISSTSDTDWRTDFASKDYDAASISYLNGDGSVRKNQWVWAVADEDWLDDDDYHWFYTDKKGLLVTDQVKKINGKYYAFDANGIMKKGFVQLNGSVDGFDTDKYTADEWCNQDLGVVYYFSSDEEKDGARKSGYQNIELADDTYQFYFQNNGEGKTEYNTKIKKFTVSGLILKPTNDDNNNYGAITADGKHIVTDYDLMEKGMKLVNKQGSLVTSKTAVKDENGAYWQTDKDGVITNKAADRDEYDAMRDKKNEDHKGVDLWAATKK